MHLIHRGILNKSFKENILKSFKASFKKGYGIETDIHVTKDEKFVCFHDFTLNRIFKKKKSIKDMKYSQIKNISTQNKKPIPLLKDLLNASKNKYPLFIEIKPIFSKKILKKLLLETSKFSKCIFISFRHKNIYNLLKIRSSTKVGLSYSRSASVKTIIKKSNNNKINCLVLDKFFLQNKKVNATKIRKYYYTIKTKSEFKRYSKNNNLIFENL
jgi:glycerophosphoryl diester phosphodiesterase